MNSSHSNFSFPFHRRYLTFFFGSLALISACSDNANQPNTDSAITDSVAETSDAIADSMSNEDATSQNALIVTTQHGKIEGKIDGDTRVFLGIPFAAPPVEGNRWRSPQPVAAWNDIRQATEFAPSCPQPSSGLSQVGISSGKTFEEDCLYLNVWTPTTPSTKKRPVMVWIHGGAFVIGGAATSVYNGKKLVEHGDLVVVSINYRLGPLGFLAHPKLGAGSGNFGFLDQQTALKWVQQNIDAFGGDPKNVTIFGESAGGISVCLHLTAPSSAGLFQRAISESGPCFPLPTIENANSAGEKIADETGCAEANDPIECLRTKTPEALLSVLPPRSALHFGVGHAWFPVLDKTIWSDQPQTLLEQGLFTKVPTIFGVNKDEGTLFAMLAGLQALGAVTYTTYIEATFGDAANEVLKRYPPFLKGTPGQTIAELIGDTLFVCPTVNAVNAIATKQDDVFLYYFTHVPSFTSLMPFLQSTHTAELPFVFGNPLIDGLNLKNEEAELSTKMMTYWTTFASSGTPNATSNTLLTWPNYDALKQEHLVFSTTPSVENKLKHDLCEFWKTTLH